MERRIRELLERFEKVEELLGHPDRVQPDALWAHGTLEFFKLHDF